MRTFYRFLLWLLIAVLPRQGGAASMLPCVDLVQTTQKVQHGSHCAPDTQQHKKAADHARCSHCSACTSALGLALVTPLLQTVLLGTVPPRTEPAPAVHIPATLERPPQFA